MSWWEEQREQLAQALQVGDRASLSVTGHLLVTCSTTFRLLEVQQAEVVLIDDRIREL